VIQSVLCTVSYSGHLIAAKLIDVESFKECECHFPDELNTAVRYLILGQRN
jgi:hypothetical protein